MMPATKARLQMHACVFLWGFTAILGKVIQLRALALVVMVAARRVPRPRSSLLRLALADLHRPGALTPTIVLSLGVGPRLIEAK